MLPRSALCSFTSVPATTPPVSSVTRPEIVAVSVCPTAPYARHNTTKYQAAHIRRNLVITEDLPFPRYAREIRKIRHRMQRRIHSVKKRRRDTRRKQLLSPGIRKKKGLRMVWRATEIGVQDLLTARFVMMFAGGFG